ncbi:MAG: recombinase family protein, partial [Phycisphaerales bacterium]
MSEIVNTVGPLPDPELYGLKALRWIRCSSDGQADTSPDGQRLTTNKFASINGIQIIEEIEFVGSGSEAKNIEYMLEMVLELVRKGVKLDLVLVNDLSRLGRGGGDLHGHVVFTLAKNGIRVVSATQHMPQTRYTVLFRQMTSFSDQEYADRIANNTANGAMRSILEGRSLPTRIPHYGTFFEYSTSDRELIGFYRRLRDGDRQLLDPQSQAVQHTYQAGMPGYRKRKQDFVTLIPGVPDEQRVVIDIFEMYYLCGMSFSEIAKHLNSDYPVDFDVAWDSSSIRTLVLSECFTGFCYANRFTNHMYCQRGPASPVASITWGSKRYGIRPMDEWVRIDLPRMVDFLPPELKAVAEIGQAEFWSQFEDGHEPTPRTGNGRRDYPLSNLITEQVTGEAMKGVLSGPKGRERRYYRLSETKIKKALAGPDAPADRSAISRGIPADFVEREFYCRLECLLRSIGDFRGMLVQEIKSQDSERCKETQDLDQLLRER